MLPTRNADIEFASFDSDIVAYDTRTALVHLVSGLQAVLLDACDGVTATDAFIEDAVSAGLGDQSDVTQLLLDAFVDLVDLALLDGFEPAGGPPCIGCFGEVVIPRRRRVAFGRRGV